MTTFDPHKAPLIFEERQAFAAVCVFAVSADGVVRDQEVSRLVIDLSEKKLFRDMGLDGLGELLREIVRLVQERDADTVLEAAKNGLSPKLRETAFALSADLILADGEVAAKEKTFIERFRKALEIDEAMAYKIAEVIAIKNRG
jgi:tellurite resistance protein